MQYQLSIFRVIQVLFGTVLISGLAIGEPLLTPHTAEYKIKVSVVGGTLVTQLMPTADGYRAESLIKAKGVARTVARGDIRESSEFTASADGIRPNRFLSNDSLSKNGGTADFTFDWETNSISGTLNGEEFHTEMDGIVHDNVSLQYGLVYDLINGDQRSEYSLQAGGKFKLLSISHIGTESVTVPFGKYEAIGVRHQTEGSSRTTTLWCVESLGYLPVIVEQHRNGKLQFRAELTKYTAAAPEQT